MPWPGVLSVGKPSIKKPCKARTFSHEYFFTDMRREKHPDPRLFPQEKRETGPH